MDSTIERYLLPRYWPLFWRRAFVLTIPISGLLWLMLLAVVGLVLLAALLALTAILGVFELKEACWERHADDH